MLNKTNKKALVRMYIESHPGCSLSEVAREVGVSRALVSIVRAEIRAANPDSLPDARTPAPSLDDTPSAQTFAEIIAKVLAGEGRKLTPQEQAQVYSGLATHPRAQPGTVISALNGLRALEASAQQTNDIGPGPPLTREAKVHRLSLLLEAVGLDIATDAWKRVYSLPHPSETDALGANLEASDPIGEEHVGTG